MPRSCSYLSEDGCLECIWRHNRCHCCMSHVCAAYCRADTLEPYPKIAPSEAPKRMERAQDNRVKTAMCLDIWLGKAATYWHRVAGIRAEPTVSSNTTRWGNRSATKSLNLALLAAFFSGFVGKVSKHQYFIVLTIQSSSDFCTYSKNCYCGFCSVLGPEAVARVYLCSR